MLIARCLDSLTTIEYLLKDKELFLSLHAEQIFYDLLKIERYLQDV